MKDAALVCPLFLHNIFQTKTLYSMALIQPEQIEALYLGWLKCLVDNMDFHLALNWKRHKLLPDIFKKLYDFCINWNTDLCDRIRFLRCHMQGMWDIIRRSQNILFSQDWILLHLQKSCRCTKSIKKSSDTSFSKAKRYFQPHHYSTTLRTTWLILYQHTHIIIIFLKLFSWNKRIHI